MGKLLTIAIPTYNRKEYLKKALQSIFSQSDERMEVLISDNCSEDGTQKFVEENYPEVIYYRNETNVGMENFKRCYDRAEGKFILLLGDDDLIVDGKLCTILDFLEANQDTKITFLNHTFFKNSFDGNIEKSFASKSGGNFVTTDKNRFIDIARYQVTLISCIVLSKQAYLTIDDVEKYSKNWFLQTCVAFESTKALNSKLGVISDVCIAQNNPTGGNNLNMSVYVDVFVVTEHAVFTEIGVKCGYGKAKMNKIFSDFICERYPNYILACKAKNVEWKKSFWEEAFPIVKKYIKAWFTIIPAAIMPTGIVKIAYVLKHRQRGNK